MAQAEADPASVHPEHERPTPDNIDDWTQEQIDRWNELREDEILSEVREDRARLEEEQEEALSALRDPEREEWAEAEVDDLTFKVRTYANEDVEDGVAALAEAHEGADTAADLRLIRTQVPGLMAWFIVEPEEYADPQVWREYARRFGIGELSKAYLRVVEPYLDANEEDRAVKKFRRAGRRSTSR